ncbi:hypothetical protein F949_02261 [Acinetobacter junii NIPH 182]|uniref:hypothetical protein n=1 Tax=Acinetobacter junii TaxID=40215 RepID=UPI0002CE9BF9|nr:hypothetical protein [Acinetobacter junii]ENV63416.1 hypothetical protein F949_02261 [Acinetobacter junii NIPH 182]
MKNIFIFIALIFSSIIHAETLAQFESRVVKNYKDKSFYDVNQSIETEIVAKIQNDKTSFSYSFSAFQDHYNLRIHYSPDKKIKFYTFDIGGGGTMGEFSSYSQTLIYGKHVVTPIETGFILDVKQSLLNKQPIYLIESYYKGSSCVGTYAIQGFKLLASGELEVTKIFQTTKSLLDQITVDYDCNHHMGSNDEPEYIRISKDLSTIDILLLNQNFKPLNKYLRYVKKDAAYQYLGTVK